MAYFKTQEENTKLPQHKPHSYKYRVKRTSDNKNTAVTKAKLSPQFNSLYSRARQYKSYKIKIITWFKSYPYKDENIGCTVTRRNEMSHTKPEPNASKGIRMTVAEQKQQEV